MIALRSPALASPKNNQFFLSKSSWSDRVLNQVIIDLDLGLAAASAPMTSSVMANGLPVAGGAVEAFTGRHRAVLSKPIVHKCYPSW